MSNILTNMQNMTRKNSSKCSSGRCKSWLRYSENFLKCWLQCGSAHIQREPGKVPSNIRQNVKITEIVIAPESLGHYLQLMSSKKSEAS